MLKEGTKAPDFTLQDKDGNILKAMEKVKPDTNAEEIIKYLELK